MWSCPSPRLAIKRVLPFNLQGWGVGAFAVVLVLLIAATCSIRAWSQEWKSGQDSPVHDSDRTYAVSGKQIVLENTYERIAFDEQSGAIVEFTNKATGWHLQGPPQLGESFRLFVPTPERSYNPVLGARNHLASFHRSPDGTSVELVWSGLDSEYLGKLDIELRGTVRLEGSTVAFSMDVVNHSPYTLATVSWPVLGALSRPPNASSMTVSHPEYGNMTVEELYPSFHNSQGYFGANYPMQLVSGRFILAADPNQGLYVGDHDMSAKEIVKYLLELKPGYSDSFNSRFPAGDSISHHPVRMSLEVIHYPFFNSGESGSLSKVVLGSYRGDWHAGVDIYKRWKTTWYRPPIVPPWSTGVYSWQQLQINSSEDDLRTPYKDLPRRAEEAVKNGITAIQLVGWNKGGQDRGNPTNDVDPRLGTAAELKDSIAQIQKMGVHVVLFAKYPWADLTTDWYKQELHKYMATDPYGVPYYGAGYEYQTPEQFAGINVRRFGVACTNDKAWLDVAAREFQKLLNLDADGLLFDESQHHFGAEMCFSTHHGHHSPATLWSGDIRLGNELRGMVRNSVGEKNFLLSGEDPEDLLYETYSLGYFRIYPGHIPEERYANPFRPLMIAVTGFDDREMINRALMDRYIISYEPFNFKGNIDDFPLTIAYGKKVDALRKRYEDYLWNAEFRDTLEAKVRVAGKPYEDYTVFRRKDGKHAVVLVDTEKEPITATVSLDQPATSGFVCASPERPEAVSCTANVRVAPRSAVILMEK
jgi:hypothetical protein